MPIRRKKRSRKNIVVVYWGDDWKKETPLADADPTRKSFEDWHDRGLAHNVHMFRASFRWYDPKKNVFNRVWAYRNGKWEKRETKVRPHLIFDKIVSKRNYKLFDKKMEASKKVKIFNNPLFRTFIDNKLSQYLFLSEFMPKSYLANRRSELKEVVKKIKTERVVIKPLYGSGGFGIKIPKKMFASQARVDFPVLVQEFIKSEKGIPGFSKQDEVADLRLVYMNHELVYSLTRIAKKGSLFTNFHQGASALLIPRKKVPKSVKVMAKKLVDKFKIFPEANYCLDFIFDNKGKPYLVEVNTTPGFDLLHLVGTERKKRKNFEEFIKVA